MPLPQNSSFTIHHSSVSSSVKKKTSLQHSHLVVGISQVIDGSRFPEFSEVEESAWPEPIFCHDDKVGEESGSSLDQTKLKNT
jgi:hypothetical protein